MPETILVIEDERMTRTNLLGFLRSEGYESLGAANGKEGIQLAQRHLPDLIICDILMPELDGYDVLMTLQKNPQTASIPFIFLTVAADEDGFRHGLSLGADDYLSKPVTSKQLGAAITAQLKKKLKNSDLPLPVTSSADWVPHPVTPPVSVESVESVESAKAKLLEMLCPALQHKLTSLTEKVEQIHLSTAGLSATGSSTDKYQNAQQLQVEFVRLLSLVNEVSALQKSLTAANATLLLEDFSLMAKRTFEHDQ